MSWSELIVIGGVALCGPALLWIGHRTRSGGQAASPISQQLRYQAIAIPFAILVWLAVRVVVPAHSDLLQVGNLAAPVDGLGWMGVGAGDQWSTLLITTGSIIVVVTAAVLWLQVGRRAGITFADVARALPWAVAFAVLNATIEELIFRVALLEGLQPAMTSGAITAAFVAVISGLLFGLPHWFGDPGGPVGAILAAFLGWLSATATLQTGGIAWAWLLHVVLDVVIFGVVFAAAGTIRPRVFAPQQQVRT
jgi:membrane protease YdiL (CAAX protease family)